MVERGEVLGWYCRGVLFPLALPLALWRGTLLWPEYLKGWGGALLNDQHLPPPPVPLQLLNRTWAVLSWLSKKRLSSLSKICLWCQHGSNGISETSRELRKRWSTINLTNTMSNFRAVISVGYFYCFCWLNVLCSLGTGGFKCSSPIPDPSFSLCVSFLTVINVRPQV